MQRSRRRCQSSPAVDLTQADATYNMQLQHATTSRRVQHATCNGQNATSDGSGRCHQRSLSSRLRHSFSARVQRSAQTKACSPEPISQTVDGHPRCAQHSSEAVPCETTAAVRQHGMVCVCVCVCVLLGVQLYCDCSGSSTHGSHGPQVSGEASTGKLSLRADVVPTRRALS